MRDSRQSHSTSTIIALAAITIFVFGSLNAAAMAGTPYILDPPLALQDPARYIPEDNPLTKEKVELGKLFFLINGCQSTIRYLVQHATWRSWPIPMGSRSQPVCFAGKVAAARPPQLIDSTAPSSFGMDGRRH